MKWYALARPVAAAAALCAALAASPAEAAKARELVFTSGWPAVSDQEITIKEIPFAPGAPAVVLLDARQEEWCQRGPTWVHRQLFFRRLKVLTEEGARRFAEYTLRVPAAVRADALDARTLLPGGTPIDAKDFIRRAPAPGGAQTISVAFPRVQPGAILEISFAVLADIESGFGVEPFAIQGPLPKLEARFVYLPMAGLKWSTAFSGVPRELSQPTDVALGGVRHAFVWSFTNVPALPDEPFSPPAADAGMMMYVVPLSFHGDMTASQPLVGAVPRSGGAVHNSEAYDIAKDWTSWSALERDRWNTWSDRKNAQIRALGAAAAAGPATAQDKAEAVRRALAARVRVEVASYARINDDADDALAAGRVSTAEFAGLARVALREAGVSSTIAATRRRSDGRMPLDFPVPPLFDDAILLVDVGGSPTFWAPASGLPVGALPTELRGVAAMPLDGAATRPLTTPAPAAGDNRAARTTKGTLDASGTIVAQTTITPSKGGAGDWRIWLRGATDDAARRAVAAEYLRPLLPAAEVTAVSAVNLDDESKELQIVVEWKAERAAKLEGATLRLKPALFAPLRSADWAAAGRATTVVLGDPRDETDVVTLQLPEGVASAKTVPALRMPTSSYGAFEGSCDSWSGKVVMRRHVRVDAAEFPASAWSGVRTWYGRIAQFDDADIVVELPKK
ncbi:DUF3857 domain-containing protein [bacterium]|nr:DUF3857 domain-containing protein [bacterium]